LASNLHYKDPIVEEWNFTVERDLGKGVGVRVSYDGNHSYNVPTLANINQVPANTRGFNDPTTQADIPVKLNNFGAYVGGPVIFPKLYAEQLNKHFRSCSKGSA
jgi:hypothetical protein